MDFSTKDNDGFDSNATDYRVPISGIYMISDRIYKAVFTGKFETIKNPNKYFWEFWKPDFIQKEIIETKIITGGQRIEKLSKGEVVKSTFPPYKIQN